MGSAHPCFGSQKGRYIHLLSAYGCSYNSKLSAIVAMSSGSLGRQVIS